MPAFRRRSLPPVLSWGVGTATRRVIWQAFLGSEGLVRGFYCSSDGNNKKFASSKIHFQILLMRQEMNQGKCETHVLLFTSICYERKHVSDLSMHLFCFRSQTFVVYLRTTKVHSNQRFHFKELTLHFLLRKSCL